MARERKAAKGVFRKNGSMFAVVLTPYDRFWGILYRLSDTKANDT
jgi:hypothetical protein